MLERAGAAVVLSSLALGACGGATEPENSRSAREKKSPAARVAPAGEASPSVIGKAPPATGGFPSVIILDPQAPERLPVPTEPQVLDQFGTEFHPGVLLVRVGQPVLFRNSENLGHNVHVVESDTDASVFNVDTPMYASYQHVFERTGVYRVRCNIHPAMRAFVVVTSSLHAVLADKDGHFSLARVPPGSYRVTVWNLDAARRIERVVRIEASQTKLILERGDSSAP